MIQPVISVCLVVLTVASLVAEALALRGLRRDESPAALRLRTGLIAGISLVCGGLFGWRLLDSAVWQPLTAHLDGLLLIGALLAAAATFLQTRPQLRGLTAFSLPPLTLILAWGVCAATWTYRPFDLPTLHPVWMGLHLISVYLGTLGAIVAAVAGGMYLYVQRRLKQKKDLMALGRLASLEMLEGLIIRAATLGFVLLSLGLATGLVILLDASPGELATGWLSPKIVLATIAWAAFAVVMNVRYATSFRGARAAWLAIAGLVLLLTVYGIVTAMPSGAAAAATKAGQPAATRAPSPEGGG